VPRLRRRDGGDAEAPDKGWQGGRGAPRAPGDQGVRPRPAEEEGRGPAGARR